MHRKLYAAILAAVMALTAGGALFAQRGTRAQETLEVKVASAVPRESPWGRTLDRIASEWNRITNGEVRLRVLHGGTEGGEDKMYLSLASNTIQAAVFTTIGLSSIDPVILTTAVPFLIRNEAELNAVMDVIQPDLEARINSGNYFLLAWSRSGFLNFFTREPILTPDDLQRQRIGGSPETEDMNNFFKGMGFQIVEVGLNEVGQKVATNAVSAVYLPPSGAAAYQIQSYLKNMMATNIAPLLGGLVINQVTWRRIGSLNPRYQQDLIRVTRQLSSQLDGSIQQVNNDSLTAMTRTGLTVTRPSPVQEQQWYALVEQATPSLLGTVYDRDLYGRISAILAQFRSRGR